MLWSNFLMGSYNSHLCKNCYYRLTIFLYFLQKMNLFHRLETLFLSGNRIPEFPDDISQMDYIRVINFSGCALISLPSTIGCLANLTHLIVPENRLKTLPGSIGSCQSLRVINASHNNLERLPNSLCDSPCLESLDLRYNSLLSLTQYLGRLTSLTALQVTNNTLINASRSLSRCCLIRSLDFSHNHLDERSLQDCVIPSCTDLNFPAMGSNRFKNCPSKSLLVWNRCHSKKTTLYCSS